MTVHNLKTLPPFFEAVADGSKTFEVRRYDRNFQAGDFAILREWTNGSYTGRWIRKKITYVLSDPAFGTQPGFAVLALA